MSFICKCSNACCALSDSILFSTLFNLGYELLTPFNYVDMLNKLPEQPLFSIAAGDAF